MKYNGIIKLLLTASACMALYACGQKVEYVEPTWARMISPEEGSMVKMDFFKPDDIQVFAWEKRPGATYNVSFDVNMHFENAVTLELGATDSLKIKNSELLGILKTVDPYFTGSKRFFWRLEQIMNGETAICWRYFNALPLVEKFTDTRDGEVYTAEQFILEDGSLLTIMAENLRATAYTDGEELIDGAKEHVSDGANSGNGDYMRRIGRYYSWRDAVRMTWDEAKAAHMAGEPVQGICPDGWHVPSMKEWSGLISKLGANAALESKDPAFWSVKDGITNSSGLSFLPSGYYWHEGVGFITEPDWVACFWTATPRLAGLTFAWGDVASEDDPTKAVCVTAYNAADNPALSVQSYSTVAGQENRMYPIRCVMDAM